MSWFRRTLLQGVNEFSSANIAATQPLGITICTTRTRGSVGFKISSRQLPTSWNRPKGTRLKTFSQELKYTIP